MYKFTHAAIVDGFVQALGDNGEIFILGIKQSDEFGMKMVDISPVLWERLGRAL